jgi:serine/threonine-protein kinase
MPAAVRVAMIALLLVAAAGAAFGLGSWSTDGDDIPRAVPDRSEPAPLPPATPATRAPSAMSTTGASSSPSSATAEPAGGLDDAVDSVISVVKAGQAVGQIRDDVAVDLINLLRELDDASPEDVSRRVAELQQKIRDRLDEGALARTYADELRIRLDRVAPA